jgi:hypothetical protein
MPSLQSLTIRPILGLKTDVPQNDPSLFNGEACHCVDMQNVDLNRIRNASSKSTGITAYNISATAQHTKCQGLFELKSGSTVDHLYWDNGKFYYVASDRSFTNVDASSPIQFGTGDSDLVSAINVGGYCIFTTRDAGKTAYKWKNGDANLTKFLVAGTEYKFKYLAPFQRRVFGANSTETNGDIEIRWTQAWTESNYFASAATMAAGNQLFKPGNDSITGIKPLGSNACILYGEDSICTIDYFVNYTTPFAINERVSGQGSVNHHSIVDVGGIHYFFNRNYGFVGYSGGQGLLNGGKPISYDIEDKISGINPAYFPQIVGKFLAIEKTCVWAVPLDGAATPNTLLYYDLMSGQWSVKKIDCRYIDAWTLDSSLIWNDLAALGYTYWSDFGLLRWSDLISSRAFLVHGNTNGYAYLDSGESNAGAAWDGWRIEPIISLSETQRALLLEVWFGVASTGNYYLYVYYRGGDTEAECEASSWEALQEVSVNIPDNAVCYLAKNNRYHQIKWGTDAASEPFSVNTITFKYIPQGTY